MPSAREFVSAASLAFTVLFLMPSLLYLGDATSLRLPFGNLVLLSLLIALPATLLLAFIARLLRPRVELAAWFAGIALAIAIKAALLPSAVPVLDGETPFVKFNTLAGIWSLASLILAGALAGMVVKKAGAAVYGLILTAVIAIGFQPLLNEENWTFRSPFAPGPDVHPFLEFSRAKDNVLVVLIDTFQSDVFSQLMDSDAALRGKFDGFTLFHNTVANAPYTLLAMMPIYSGRIYEGGSLRSFYAGVREDSLFTDFEHAGYETALGGYYFFNMCPAQKCYQGTDFSEPRVVQSDILKLASLWDLAALRVTPTFLHRWIYRNGKGRSAMLLPFTDPGRAGWSVDTLRAIAQGLTASGEKPTFKFVHVLATHSPIVLDGDCEDGKARALVRQFYKAQALCAVRLTARLLDSLREKGLYDDMTIVVMADHGASISGEPPQEVYLGEVRPRTSLTGGRFNPLFAVKPKGATGPLRLSAAPLQPSDLRATICGMTSVCKGSIPGRSAWAFGTEEDRSRSFIDYGSWAHRYSARNDMLPLDKVVHYTVGGGPDDVKRVYRADQRQLVEGK